MSSKSFIATANTGDGSISIIDPSTWEKVEQVQLPRGSGPYDIIKVGSSSQALVTLSYADSLAYLDLARGKILDIIAIGRHPCHIAYKGNSNLAFVTNSDTDSVSIISITQKGRLRLMGQIEVGSMPQGLDLNPKSGELAIANFNTNDITIIDTGDISIKHSIRLDQNPIHVRYCNSGVNLYITYLSSYNNDIGGVIVIDTKENKVLYRIPLKEVPGQIYITKDEKYALITSMGKGGLEIIDINRREVMGKVATNGMTHGLIPDKNEGFTYVTNPDDDSISLVDWKLGKKIATMKVGKEPNGIVLYEKI